MSGRHRGAVRPRRLAGIVTTAAVFAVVALLSLAPMGRLAVVALMPDGVPDLAALAASLARPAALAATWHTLDTAACGALAALALGVPFAVAVALTDMPFRRTAAFLLLLPMMIAPQVTALAFLHLLGPSSALLNAVGLAPAPGTPNPLIGRTGIILLYGIQHAPIVFVTLRVGLARLPRDFVEAARAAGAGPLRLCATIIAPLVAPYLLAAAALAFVSGVGNFGIPALLGLPAGYRTLPTLIYERMSGYGPGVLAEMARLSLMIGALAILGMAGEALATGRAPRFAGGLPARLSLGRWRWPAALLAFAVLALVLVLPALALLSTALVPAFGVRLSPETATLDNFAEVLTRQEATMRAFRNSAVLSLAAAAILAAGSIPFVAAAGRLGPRARRLVQGALELPYAVPGIVLAIACILLFLKPLPLVGSLYGTAAIILVAYLMRFALFAIRPVEAAMRQIPPELSEAAAAAGAGPLRRLADILAPLVAPAAVAGGLLAFMGAFNELTVSALLWSGGNETLGVVLYSLEEAGLAAHAAAIAVSTIVAVVAILAVLDRLARRLPAGVLPWH